MKIAYLILAHTDPIHLKRLVESLSTPETIFFIHIDAKSKNDFSNLKGLSNVFITPDRIKTFWGGYSLIEATLLLIKQALHSGFEFDYAVLLSGADYPIKSNSEISSFLRNPPVRQLLKAFYIPPDNKHFRKVSQYHFLDYFGGSIPHKITKHLLTFFFKCFFRQKFPTNIHLHFGSQWWALTKDCVKYMDTYVQNNPEYKKLFQYAFAPDELFFTTLIYNSPYKNECVETFQLDTKLTELNVEVLGNIHHIDNSLAKVYRMNDCKVLSASEKLFTRKFSTQESTNLLDWIDQNLRS